MDQETPVASPKDRAQWLDDCRERILQWSRLHISSFLEKSHEALFEQANHARHDKEQSQLMHASQHLRSDRERLGKSLLDHIDNSFNLYLQQNPTTHIRTEEESNLALVDKAALEERIAIETMSRRIATDASEVLHALNQRFAALRGSGPVNDHTNPVAPGVFAEGLQAALASVDMDISTRLLIFKFFERHFMSKLPKLLALINYQFQAQGVLPNLRFHVKKQQSTLPDDEPNSSVEEDDNSRLRQQQLSGLIQRLQSQRPASANKAQVLPTVQVIASLSPVQQKSSQRLLHAETPEEILASHPEEFVIEILEQSHKVSRLDSELIEFVGLLFEYMLNNTHINDAVKALLSYLHTPLMKLALQDRNFFQQTQHPARQLLNTLVAAAERWAETDNRKSRNSSDTLVFQEMRRVVQRVVDEFRDDTRLFASLTFEFNRFIREHARRIIIVERRSQQAAAGEARLRAVRQRVETFLQQKIAGQQLPNSMLTLLFEPWASFLTFNLLRFGRNSSQWQHAMAATQKLLRCLRGDPATPPSNLSIALQAGFSTVGYADEQCKIALDALQQWYQQVRSPLQTTTTDDATTDTDIDAIPLHDDSNQKPLLDELLAMQSGHWFLFNADQAKPKQQLLKLSWHDSDSREFLFVNRRGQQIRLSNASELINDIENGKIRLLGPLDERPFFEQALENIADQFRNP